METKIIILGDLYPNGVDVYPKIMENDFCVANLECAITESDNAIEKDGPLLKVSLDRVKILKTLGVNLVGLANNHVLDFGLQGLNDTIENLEKNQISYSGSSPDVPSFTKNINKKTFSFYFVSEHQYNYFINSKTGVNILDLDRCFNEIKRLKESSDIVFVMFHGGKEYYEYPTPKQQEVCRKFVDSGADVVVCQHSHCIGCEEKYKDSTIVYGQGNFAFPYRENKHFKTGLIIEAIIAEDNSIKLHYIPTLHENPQVIELAPKNKANSILEGFYERSNKLREESAEELYAKYVDKNGFDFLYKLLNKGSLYTRLDTSRLFKNRMLKRYIRKNRDYFAYLFNYFNCETHVEYIKAIIDRHIRKGEK